MLSVKRQGEKHGKGGGHSGAKREARKRWRTFRSSKCEKSKAKVDCSVLTTANHSEVYWNRKGKHNNMVNKLRLMTAKVRGRKRGVSRAKVRYSKTGNKAQ